MLILFGDEYKVFIEYIIVIVLFTHAKLNINYKTLCKALTGKWSLASGLAIELVTLAFL